VEQRKKKNAFQKINESRIPTRIKSVSKREKKKKKHIPDHHTTEHHSSMTLKRQLANILPQFSEEDFEETHSEFDDELEPTQKKSRLLNNPCLAKIQPRRHNPVETPTGNNTNTARTPLFPTVIKKKKSAGRYDKLQHPIHSRSLSFYLSTATIPETLLIALKAYMLKENMWLDMSKSEEDEDGVITNVFSQTAIQVTSKLNIKPSLDQLRVVSASIYLRRTLTDQLP
jgi:hypothetical protein